MKLFPFQTVGAEWLSKKKVALLADEMGLGKSAQAIVAADKIGAERILVLCPAVAKVNWEREFEKFSSKKRKFQIIKSRTQVANSSLDSVIVSYDLLVSNPGCAPGNFDLLIVDESHFLKSTEAKRTHTVFGKEGIVRRAKRTWCLSGTPAPNNASELWAILYTFGVTSFAYNDFILRYCDTVPSSFGTGRKIIGNKKENLPELKEILAKVMLRRKTDDVMKDLPPIRFSDLVVEPGLVDIGYHQDFLHYLYPENRTDELQKLLLEQARLIESTTGVMGFGKDAMMVLEGLAKSVSTVRKYVGLQKVQPTVDLITAELEAKAYDKIVLFAIHKDVIAALRNKLQKFKPVTLYGGTPAEKRMKHIDDFQNKPWVKVFIGQVQAAGINITLTAASQILFVESDWVPGNNAQAAMRCRRIGQTRPVNVRIMSVVDSFDAQVNRVLKNKTKDLMELFE